MIDLNNDDAVKALVDKAEALSVELNLALDGVKDPDVLGDVLRPLSQFRNPRAVGQLLMELLADPMDCFGAEEKLFWTEVMAHMGPDWIEIMRFKAAFMQSVDNFTPRS